MKKTKIVCTIGPASESVDMLVNLINAGMNVCRLNFSHGDYEEHGARIKNIREAVKITGKRVAILLVVVLRRVFMPLTDAEASLTSVPKRLALLLA